MLDFNAQRGVRRLLEVCGGLQPKETVAIVTDMNKIAFANLMAGGAAALGAEPTVAVIPQRSVDGDEPTGLASELMQAADLVVLAPSYSLAHAQATRNALKKGARVLSIPDVTEVLLSRGGLYADFRAIQPICERLAAIFEAGKELRATAPGGTDITVSIKDRPGNSHHCIADRSGMFTAIPNIEANVSPVEGSGTGRIVFDGSIPNFKIGVLSEPVTLDVVDGRIVKVSGGWQARMLERLWERQNDPAVYNLAQVAVGLNPECHMVTGQLTNDHGVLGTMHFGIGTSTNLGGQVKAPMHMDGILWYPTITVDDQVIMRGGVPEGDWAEGLLPGGQ